MSNSTSPGALFEGAFDKPVCTAFDGADSSLDGGLALMAAAANRMGLFGALAGCLEDGRAASRIRHTNERLLAQRVMAIVAGYSDCSDGAALRADPMLQLAIGCLLYTSPSPRDS